MVNCAQIPAFLAKDLGCHRVPCFWYAASVVLPRSSARCVTVLVLPCVSISALLSPGKLAQYAKGARAVAAGAILMLIARRAML